MNDLLDAVLANTSYTRSSAVGPVVVSEQHDTGKINTGGSGSGGGGGGLPSDSLRKQLDSLRGSGSWDEAEYGISRAEQIAKLETSLGEALAYEATPEGMEAARVAAERALSEMRARAIRRAGLDTTGGRVAVMVAGKPAWHGLGVNVAEAVSSADAIRLASLDWSVEKIPLTYRSPVTGVLANADGNYGIVRGDTGGLLGTVGEMYLPFQNSEGFAFLDSVMAEFGAKYESAGALYGGSKVWMLVKLPAQGFSVNGSDTVESYAIFTNSHDGTEAARCFPTTQRVVCANTFRLAKADARRGLVIRHTGNLKGRIASAQTALGVAVREVAEFQESAEALVKVKVDPLPYFEGLLDAVLDVTRADALVGADALAAVIAKTEAEQAVERARIERQIQRRKVTLEDVLERYESETNGIGGMRGTAWAAFNAITESADHGVLGGRQVGQDKASRRFESVLTGRADEVKQLAYEQVLALAN